MKISSLFGLVCGCFLSLPVWADLSFTSDPVDLAMPLAGTAEILLTSDYQLSDLRVVSGLSAGSCKYEGVYYSMTPCFETRDESTYAFDLQFRSKFESDKYDWIKGVRVQLEQKADGIYAHAVAAFYYDQKLGVGTHSYAEIGNGTVSGNTLYDGSNNGYGVQQLTVVAHRRETRSEPLPEGTVTIGAYVELTLTGAAAAGTVSNDFVFNGEVANSATLKIDAASNVEFTGAFSGSEATVSVTTGAARQVTPEEGTATENSVAAVLTTNYQIVFANAALDDIEILSAAMCGNTDGLTANPYFLTRSGDTLTVEFQQVGAVKDWIKGVKVELVQRGVSVYGKAVRAYYYKYGDAEYDGIWRTNQVGDFSVDGDAEKINANGNANQDLNTTGTGSVGYGIRTISAQVRRQGFARSSPENLALTGFGAENNNPSHSPARVLEGACVEDIIGLTAASGDVSANAELTVLPAKVVPDGLEFQLQFLDGGWLKCVFLRLVNTADNAIAAYLPRCCAFPSSGVTVGTDLSDVPCEKEKQSYGLSRIDFLLKSETTAPCVTFAGANTLVNERLEVASASRVRLANPLAIPTTGTLDVGENGKLLVDTPSGADLSLEKAYDISAAEGAHVVCFGRTPGVGAITLDGALLTLLARHERNFDFGVYLKSIELKNGAAMTGYTPRANNQTKLIVSGEGLATVQNGFFPCIGNTDGGYYTVDVADTVSGAGVDLEVSGPIFVYGGNNQGGTIRKTGDGTMRLNAVYDQSYLAPNRLDAGGWILAVDNVWGAKNALTLAGGTLILEDEVTGNAVPSLELLGDAELVMGAGSTLDLGDSTAKVWTDGAKLNVTKPGSATLRATGLTAAQLKQIRINGFLARQREDGTLVPLSGIVLLFR